MRAINTMTALAVAGALTLAGCGGGSSSSSSSGSSGSSGSGGSSSSSSSTKSSSSGGGGGALKLAADPNGALKYDKTKLTAKSGQVTIDFSNSSGIPHAVAIQGTSSHTQTITKGSSSLTANLKPGKYTFYCPVPGHRQAGMVGTLTVK